MLHAYRPLNYLSLRWYKKSGDGSTSRTRIYADSIKYTFSLYGRVLTINNPTRHDSGVFECEAVFTRPGDRSSTSAVAEAVLSVHGQYPMTHHTTLAATVKVNLHLDNIEVVQVTLYLFGRSSYLLSNPNMLLVNSTGNYGRRCMTHLRPRCLLVRTLLSSKRPLLSVEVSLCVCLSFCPVSSPVHPLPVDRFS